MDPVEAQALEAWVALADDKGEVLAGVLSVYQYNDLSARWREIGGWAEGAVGLWTWLLHLGAIVSFLLNGWLFTLDIFSSNNQSMKKMAFY